MMDDHPFFRRLWRFNAVVVGLAGVAGLLLCLYALFQIGQGFYRESIRDAGPAASVDASGASQQSGAPPSTSTNTQNARRERLRLGGFTSLERDVSLWAQISEEIRYGGAIASKQTFSTRDYVVLDLATGDTRPIFDGMSVLITGSELIRASRRKIPLKALLFTIVTKDTNGDGVLSHRDRKEVAVARANGGGVKVLDIEGTVTGWGFVDRERIRVVVRQGRRSSMSFELDLNSFETTPLRAIPLTRKQG